MGRFPLETSLENSPFLRKGHEEVLERLARYHCGHPVKKLPPNPEERHEHPAKTSVRKTLSEKLWVGSICGYFL